MQKPDLKTALLALSLLSSLARVQAVETDKPYISNHAAPITSAVALPKSMHDLINGFRIIAVGEVHGEDHTPILVGRLVKELAKSQPVILALEIPTAEQGHLDRYLQTGNMAELQSMDHFKREYQDGRSSTAMALLIDSMRGQKRVKILAFDPGVVTANAKPKPKPVVKPVTTSKQNHLLRPIKPMPVASERPETRDEGMARILGRALRLNPRYKMVVLAGNYHMSLKIGIPTNASFRPAAVALIETSARLIKRSDIFPIKIRYAQGSTWSCYDNVAANCGVKPVNVSDNYATATHYKAYFLREEHQTDDGYLGDVFFQNVAASSPFVQQIKTPN